MKSKQPGSSRSTALRTLLGLALAICPFAASAQHYRDFTTPQPLSPGAWLVIGFTGGIEHWDTAARPVRKLALDLRAENLPNLYVETVEHRHRGLAMKLIVAALDRNRDGRLDASERQSARIILYGHSMGGAAVVKLARELQQRRIPVLLTIQVDSIGASDSVIPANVARAANFYQHTSHVLRGTDEIRAADPAATEILGNFRYDYAHRDVDLAGTTLPERIAGGAHTKMEFDPEVWGRVRSLILLEVQRAAGGPASRRPQDER